MSGDDIKLNLNKIGAGLGIIVTLGGVIGAQFVAHYRLGAAEATIATQSVEIRETREKLANMEAMMARMDANVQFLVRKQDTQKP